MGVIRRPSPRIVDYYIAASDAPSRLKSRADYVCDGTADEVQINAALALIKSDGGTIRLSPGTFTLAAPIVIAGATANDDENPQIMFWGSGIDTTFISGVTNDNTIEFSDQPKYDIAYMNIGANGTGNGIDQQAGTERGNWISSIHDIRIQGANTHSGWGMKLESPFRMTFDNIEMQEVGNGMWLTSHTESFNPGNLTINRAFVDLRSGSTSGVGFKFSTTDNESTGHFNLISMDCIHVYGGTSQTGSIGVHFVGATAEPGGSHFGEVRGVSGQNFNIEDVKTGFKFEAASDITLMDINYLRLNDGGTAFDLDDESLNNLLENVWFDSNSANETYNLIVDANSDENSPNIFRRITGFGTSTATINATLTDASVLQHVNLGGGTPTVDSDITNRNNVFRQSAGDIGIGTSNPLSTLDVIGTFRFRDAETPTKGVRYRFGGATDMEAGGADLYLSVWSGADFSGTQHNQLIFSSSGGNIQVKRGIVFETEAYFDGEVDNGNSGTADTINWTAGNKQKSTVTGAVTYTFTAPSGPCNVVLKLVNGGSQTITWPASVLWSGGTEPSWTTSGTDIASFYYDGTNYYGQAGLNFS